MDAYLNQKRTKIGIIFNFSASWMGGIIYLLNLIKMLNFLDDNKKPELYIFYRSDLRSFIDEISYPLLRTFEWSFPSIYLGYFQSWVLRKNSFVNKILKQFDLDILYPLLDFPVKLRSNTKLPCWYADLQHKHYPSFFSRRKIIERNTRIRFMLKNSSDLVVSSQSVADDFKEYFKLKRNYRVHVFHFVSIIDNLKIISFDVLKDKYGLTEEYFLVSNQFHKHKNHRILLLSIAILKEIGIKKHLVFTGKLPASPKSPYLIEIQSIIDKYKLHDQVTILGVIPRNDQLNLIKYSQAVLQPSLFEGWSTIIEDAESLQVPVVVSDIKVNREQLGENGIYFNPHNPKELAEILKNYPVRNFNDIFYEDYSKRVKEAANTLIEIFTHGCQ